MNLGAVQPRFTEAGLPGSPAITIERLVEEDDVVMAELSIEARRANGELLRAVAGEVFVFDDDGKITERRAYLIELKDNDYK